MNNITAPANSPMAAQINEAIKNVSNFNTKVGGRRKTHRSKRRKQTRKNRKGKGTRKYGGGKPTNYSNCNHIYEEDARGELEYPSLLIEIKKEGNEEKKKPVKPGPARPHRFYDCEELVDKKGKTFYRGLSCENPSFDGMPIYPEKIKEKTHANDVHEIVDWCCPK